MTDVDPVERLDDEDPERRRRALSAITESDATPSVDPVVDCLYDPEPSVRVAAIAALERTDAHEAVGPLTSVPEVDDDPEVRRRALSALVSLDGADRAVPPLCRTLDDEDASVRETAREGLSNLEAVTAVEAVERLAAALRAADDANEGATADALRDALARVRGHEALAAFREAQASGSGDPIAARRRAQNTGRVENPVLSVEPDVTRAVREGDEFPARDALVHDDPVLRVTAAEVIAESGHRELVSSLVDALDDEDLPWVRRRLAEQLARTDDDEGFAAIARMDADRSGCPERDVRRYLRQAGGDRVVERSLDLLMVETDGDVADRLVHALERTLERDGHDPTGPTGWSPPASARRDYRERLDEATGPTPVATLQKLGLVGTAEDVDAVAGYLAADDHAVRTAAAFALGHLGVDPKAVRRTPRADRLLATVDQFDGVRSEAAGDRLRATLSGGDDEVVPERVLTALGLQGVTGAVAAVRSQLSAHDAVLRATAATALGRLGAGDHREALERAVEDEDARVRAAAASALAGAGEDARPLLVDRLESDEDPVVRARAADALGFVGGSGAVDALRAASTDPDERVRERAERALRRAEGRPGGDVAATDDGGTAADVGEWAAGETAEGLGLLTGLVGRLVTVFLLFAVLLLAVAAIGWLVDAVTGLF